MLLEACVPILCPKQWYARSQNYRGTHKIGNCFNVSCKAPSLLALKVYSIPNTVRKGAQDQSLAALNLGFLLISLNYCWLSIYVIKKSGR
jgi:hypothetical protein